MKRHHLIAASLLFLAAACTPPKPPPEPPKPVVRERVALLPASGTNVHEGYLQAAQDFLRAHLESTGHYQVTLLPGEPTPAEVPPYVAAGRANEIGADFAVTLHISRLGNTARIRVAVYDSKTGAAVHLDEMAAGSPDDFDKTLALLATSIATGKRAAETLAEEKAKATAEEEAADLTRLNATNVFGFRLSILTALSRAGDRGQQNIAGVGGYFMYDARSFLAEIALDIHAAAISDYSESNHDIMFGGSAYYPFNNTNTTPYVGGGLRFGRAAYTSGDGAEGGTGIALQGAVGVLIGRLSSIQLRAELSVFTNTFQETDGMGNKKNAAGVIFSGGMGF